MTRSRPLVREHAGLRLPHVEDVPELSEGQRGTKTVTTPPRPVPGHEAAVASVSACLRMDMDTLVRVLSTPTRP